MNRRPTIVLMCVLAVLLALNLIVTVLGGPGTRALVSEAMAQGTPPKDPPFSANDQRKMMIDPLNSINEHLTRIEAKLDKGINVKVTDMPRVKLDSDGGPKNDAK